MDVWEPLGLYGPKYKKILWVLTKFEFLGGLGDGKP